MVGKGKEGKNNEGEGTEWGERRRWENGKKGKERPEEGRQGKTRMKKKHEERSTYYQLPITPGHYFLACPNY